MRFSVIVPVLSRQIIDALPRVSTVDVFFMTTPNFISRHAPNAINVVKATGISSGRMLIARVSAFKRLARRSWDSKKLIDQQSRKSQCLLLPFLHKISDLLLEWGVFFFDALKRFTNFAQSCIHSIRCDFINTRPLTTSVP